jgi:hypothetical protein
MQGLQTELLRASGWVALAVTRQGSHGAGRACINASGSSAGSLAVPQGSPRLSEREDARAIRVLRQRVPVVAFVNNHYAGYAPETARQLRALTG